MKEFTEKLISRLEEKIKVTSLKIIVTGTKDKPYFEIEYKEVGKEDFEKHCVADGRMKRVSLNERNVLASL